jgi:alpha-D-ribose 1-methylphosphonate 5-phosphate C-P lyase
MVETDVSEEHIASIFRAGETSVLTITTRHQIPEDDLRRAEILIYFMSHYILYIQKRVEGYDHVTNFDSL